MGGSITFKDFRSLDSMEDFINDDIQVHICPYLNKNETYLSLKFINTYIFQHRLHLGITSPRESRRTVDQVPFLGKRSHYCILSNFVKKWSHWEKGFTRNLENIQNTSNHDFWLGYLKFLFPETLFIFS